MTPDPTAARGDGPFLASADGAASTGPAPRTDDIPVSWDERTILTTFLDYARDTVHAKCAGIAEEDARRAPLPGSTLMTISGLVSHLRWVEYSWFEVTLLGGEDHGPWTDEDPDREMRIAIEIRSPGCSPSMRPAAHGTGSLPRPLTWIPRPSGK
jgi:Protein of unknown function (DUF664)